MGAQASSRADSLHGGPAAGRREGMQWFAGPSRRPFLPRKLECNVTLTEMALYRTAGAWGSAEASARAGGALLRSSSEVTSVAHLKEQLEGQQSARGSSR